MEVDPPWPYRHEIRAVPVSVEETLKAELGAAQNRSKSYSPLSPIVNRYPEMEQRPQVSVQGVVDILGE